MSFSYGRLFEKLFKGENVTLDIGNRYLTDLSFLKNSCLADFMYIMRVLPVRIDPQPAAT